ncbi:unnamed protein product [Lymnaea stagnalis]|uniref:VWFC domain-containing protein n=1 Tax=Lymnaea stagnalis TaxID=6523 RepID=A0AAV2IEU7_LYMST
MFLCLISFVAVLAPSLHGAYIGEGCEYDGRLYMSGTKFKAKACTSCHCPRGGGMPNCVIEECAPDPHCIKFDNQSGECCPVCQERGCRHSDGQLFQQGEVIRNEACVRCYCPLGGGDPICDVTSCPLSQCVDPVKVPGVCCPICPKGPNCQIGLLTLPIGQSVMIEGATCTCESFLDVDGIKRTLARCNKN